MRVVIGILCSLLFAAPVSAQQTVVGERLRLSQGPCIVTSDAGPPIQLVLSGSCSEITTSPSTNLTLSPTGDLITDPIGKDVLPDLNYDINLGMLSKKYLTLHAAELWVETLVAQNTIATIGGRVLVAPTNILAVDLAAVSTTISVKYNNLNNGDRVYMESDGKVEFMAVASGDSGSGPYTYTVTRNLDGSGANQWYAGDAILNTGTTGNGFIDLYSTAGVLSSGSGPSIVGNVRTGTTYNAYAPRWAIGNLNGLYNYGADTYGAAFGDAAATNVTIDATNGFRIRSGTTNRLTADTSGNLSLVGDLSIGTAGVLRSGATGFSTGTGIWLDYNAGTPRFRIGDPAGQGMSWDGTTLVINGSFSATTGTIGGWTINATSLTDTAGTVGMSSAVTGGDDIRFFAGNVTPSSAPFRVTESGALVASNATITGAVTATSGSFTGSLTSSSGTIGGWTLGATTLTGGDAVLASSGNLTLGTGNDVFRASADNATYRLWIGHATAGSAPFRVTKAGAVTSSNLTVTGGSITGVTAEFGSTVVLDSDGITIDEGPGIDNSVKWTDGSFIQSDSNLMTIGADSTLIFTAGTWTVLFSGTSFRPVSSNQIDLGTSSLKWRTLYLANDLIMDGDIFFTPPTTTAPDPPLVYSISNGIPYRKTDVHTGTCNSNFAVESGLIVSCDP